MAMSPLATERRSVRWPGQWGASGTFVMSLPQQRLLSPCAQREKSVTEKSESYGCIRRPNRQDERLGSCLQSQQLSSPKVMRPYARPN